MQHLLAHIFCRSLLRLAVGVFEAPIENWSTQNILEVIWLRLCMDKVVLLEITQAKMTQTLAERDAEDISSFDDRGSSQASAHLDTTQSQIAANRDSDLGARVSFFRDASNFEVHGGRFYSAGRDVIIRTDDLQDRMKGIIENSRVLTAQDVPPEHEIYKGRGYRIYSAQNNGKAITVKLYEGNRAKERCCAAARFSQKVMHHNVLHLTAVCPLNSELSFLAFNGDYEGTIESMIASALEKDLNQSLVLGLQTVVGLSSGLDYLCIQNYPFASVGLDHFTILLNRKGKVVITFDPEVLGDTDEVHQRSVASEIVNRGLEIFHGLCQKTFDAARKFHYESQNIQRPYDQFDAVWFETSKNGARQLLETTASNQQNSGAISKVFNSATTSPQLPRKMGATAQRRELVWKSQKHDRLSLEDISHQFQHFLHTYSSQLAVYHRRGRCMTKTVHRCPGYNRVEIMLTTDISGSAIVNHFTPNPHEICPVCNEIVKDAEIFNCSCGGEDDELIPTIRCSICSEWHHRPCADSFLSEDQSFVCRDCQISLGPAGSNAVPAITIIPSRTTASNDVLSWTNQDCRESILFNSWGILYRFQTSTSRNGQSVTTMRRTLRPNKEDRIAHLEWAPNGGLGRVVIGRHTSPMANLARPDSSINGARGFTGPDGFQYRWKPSTTSNDVVLQDSNGDIIAFFRPTRPTRYQIGDVFGELHFIRDAGMGRVMHPPMMDMVTLTAMLYRFCTAWNV